MRVNICCGGEVTVSEPFLNLLHGDAVGEEKRGTAMTEIMKPNPAKTMTFEKLRKGLCKIIRFD